MIDLTQKSWTAYILQKGREKKQRNEQASKSYDNQRCNVVKNMGPGETSRAQLSGLGLVRGYLTNLRHRPKLNNTLSQVYTSASDLKNKTKLRSLHVVQ